MFAFQRDKPRLVRSDAIDFVHAMYLPHTSIRGAVTGASAAS